MNAVTCTPGSGLVPYKITRKHDGGSSTSTVLLGYGGHKSATGVLSWRGTHAQIATAAAWTLLGNPHQKMSWFEGALIVEGDGQTSAWRMTLQVRDEPARDEEDEGDTYAVPRCLTVSWRASEDHTVKPSSPPDDRDALLPPWRLLDGESIAGIGWVRVQAAASVDGIGVIAVWERGEVADAGDGWRVVHVVDTEGGNMADYDPEGWPDDGECVPPCPPFASK